jgi:hypothetical protein
MEASTPADIPNFGWVSLTVAPRSSRTAKGGVAVGRYSRRCAQKSANSTPRIASDLQCQCGSRREEADDLLLSEARLYFLTLRLLLAKILWLMSLWKRPVATRLFVAANLAAATLPVKVTILDQGRRVHQRGAVNVAMPIPLQKPLGRSPNQERAKLEIRPLSSVYPRSFPLCSLAARRQNSIIGARVWPTAKSATQLRLHGKPGSA